MHGKQGAIVWVVHLIYVSEELYDSLSETF